ncbi:MAG: ATP-binding protein [Bdellovibrionota bacterium]
MGVFLSRIRMRSYLLLVLVPLTLLPLLLLAGLLHIFIQASFDEEVGRRARPEISALARNLDTLEKRLSRQMLTLSHSDEIKLAALTLDAPRVQSRLKPWLETSLFDSVRVYADRGQLIGLSERNSTDELGAPWAQLFGLPESRNEREPASKNSPSLAVSSENFMNPETRHLGTALSGDFRSFLVHEGSWTLRQVRSEGADSGYVFYVFRSLFDSDGKPAGFLEGSVRMDSAKWHHLSLYQGVEFVLVGANRKVLSSSQGVFDGLFQDQLAAWTELATASETRFPSKTVKVGDTPFEFYFAPIASENNQAEAWIGVGISRAQHVFLQNRILVWVVGLTVLLSLIVISFSFLFSQKLTLPIRQLVSAAESVRSGQAVEPLRVEATEEISFLVERFNEMALSVQAAKRTLETKLEELADTNIQLTQTQDQLVQSAKMSSLGQLVAGVAHELNNPIAFIYSNMVQMRQYLKNLEQLTAVIDSLKLKLPREERARIDTVLEKMEWNYVKTDMADIVQSCLEGSVRVKDIVLGLRNFSRLDKGEIAEADLNVALKNTAKLLAGQIKNRVNVDWALCDEGFVRCNVSQVNQVFMNIIANALQAIDGEGDLLVETLPLLHHGEEFMRIRIRDSGNGMSPEVIAKIFDPFFTTKSVGDGTGLGLSIVYGIVQKHGGFIDVKSVQFPDPMHGSTFDIYFPKKGPDVDSSLDRAS